METLRTFIAIDIQVESALKKKWTELKLLLHNDSIKWVDEHTIHLTLFFLGDTPISQIDKIANHLELEISKVQAFKITLNGLGVFGNPNQPKVIWVGISESKELFKLKEIINQTVSLFGYHEPNGKFSPHITLGRVKQVRTPVELTNYIDKNRLEVFQEVEIGRVIFYQSILTTTGPIYKPLQEIKLLSP